MTRLLDAPGYAVETDNGMDWVRPLDRLVSDEKRWLAMGVDNTCPRCGHHPCALMFGDPDGEHWCLGCRVRMELEEIEWEASPGYLSDVTGGDVSV